VNILFSFTVVIAVVQSMCVSVVLWLVNREDWRKCAAVVILPLIISALYYLLTIKFHFFLQPGGWRFIFHSLSAERLILLFIIGFSLMASKSYRNNREASGGLLLALLVVCFAFCFCVLVKILSHPEQIGFGISNRYFIYLVPVNIIITTLFAGYLWQSTGRSRILRAFLCAGLFLLPVIEAVQGWLILLSTQVF
jgi:hypothetical protein